MLNGIYILNIAPTLGLRASRNRLSPGISACAPFSATSVAGDLQKGSLSRWNQNKLSAARGLSLQFYRSVTLTTDSRDIARIVSACRCNFLLGMVT